MENSGRRGAPGLDCRLCRSGWKAPRKTFARKKDAHAFIAKAKVEVREGVHTADSDSVTIRDAADLWLTRGTARGLERATLAAYEQHARLHIVPSLGRMKLSRLSAPAVRDFEDRLRTDGRSAAMIRKILTSLGSMLSDAQERGLVSRNVVRDLRSRRKKGVDRRARKGCQRACRQYVRVADLTLFSDRA